MGRKKIPIKAITDERNRHVTFNKRKSGLIKKAMELSILCNCQISLVIFNAENQLFEYCSTDPRFILQRYCQVAHLPHERLANTDYARFDKSSKTTKGKKKGVNGNENDNSNDSYSQLSDQMSFQQQAQNFNQLQNAAFGQAMGDPRFNTSVDPTMLNNATAQLRNPLNSFANDNIPFTPLTPNFSEDMHELIRQNMNNSSESGNAMVKSEALLPQPQSYDQSGIDQQQQQQQLLLMQQYDNNKRKHLPSYDELGQEQQDEDSPLTKKRKFNSLTIQVPANRPQVPMVRLEGDSLIPDLSHLTQDQLRQIQALQQQQQQQQEQQLLQPQQQQQYNLPLPQQELNQPFPQQELNQTFQAPKEKVTSDSSSSMNSSGTSSETQREGLTPLSVPSFSPYTTDKSPSSPGNNIETPTTLNAMDWSTKPKESITTVDNST